MSRLDFIPVQRAAWLVNPGDFIRPDGSIDVTIENLGEREHVEAVNRKVEAVRAERRAQAARELADRLREATPLTWDTPKHEGGEL